MTVTVLPPLSDSVTWSPGLSFVAAFPEAAVCHVPCGIADAPANAAASATFWVDRFCR